jgi:hypothetical protein
MPPLSFTAPIYKIGQLRCLDIPPRISAALGGDTRIPVRGTIGGVAIRPTTLVAAGDGTHRLFVHGKIRKALGVDDGDRVRVVLERDTKADIVVVPGDMLESLAERPDAEAVFDSMTPAQRREIVRWLESAKTIATRKSRLERNLDMLVERGVRTAGRAVQKRGRTQPKRS